MKASSRENLLFEPGTLWECWQNSFISVTFFNLCENADKTLWYLWHGVCTFSLTVQFWNQPTRWWLSHDILCSPFFLYFFVVCSFVFVLFCISLFFVLQNFSDNILSDGHMISLYSSLFLYFQNVQLGFQPQSEYK